MRNYTNLKRSWVDVTLLVVPIEHTWYIVYKIIIFIYKIRIYTYRTESWYNGLKQLSTEGGLAELCGQGIAFQVVIGWRNNIPWMPELASACVISNRRENIYKTCWIHANFFQNKIACFVWVSSGAGLDHVQDELMWRTRHVSSNDLMWRSRHASSSDLMWTSIHASSSDLMWRSRHAVLFCLQMVAVAVSRVSKVDWTPQS